MKLHLRHFLMCLPMIALVAVLIATGSSALTLIPLAACLVVMLALMSFVARDKTGDPPTGQGERG